MERDFIYIYILGFNLNVVHILTRDVKRALERVNKNALEAAIWASDHFTFSIYIQTQI